MTHKLIEELETVVMTPDGFPDKVRLEAAQAILTLIQEKREARSKALEEAKRAADEIAGNTKDFDRDHRRGAGAVSAAISVLLNTLTPGETP